MTIYKRETMQGLYEDVVKRSAFLYAKYEDGTYFYSDIEIEFKGFWEGFESAMRVFNIPKE